MRNFCLTVVIAVMVTSCSPNAVPPSAEQQAQITTEVEAAVRAWMAAAGAGQEDETFAYFSDTVLDVPMPSEGQVFSPNDFRVNWRQAMSSLDRQEFPDLQVAVRVLGYDLAVSTAHSSYFVVDTAGVASDTVPYAHTAVWIREGQDWKVLTQHQSVSGGWPGGA